jgi:hypothetical protein
MLSPAGYEYLGLVTPAGISQQPLLALDDATLD